MSALVANLQATNPTDLSLSGDPTSSESLINLTSSHLQLTTSDGEKMSSGVPPSAKLKVKVKQACDCCHARKIRCDGANPCANCLVTELHCTYLAVPKKKGPKGRRIPKVNVAMGKVSVPYVQIPPPVSRTQDIKSQVPIASPVVPAGPPTLPFQLALPVLQATQTKPIEPPKPDIDRFQRSPLVSDDLIKACVDAFFTHKYPIMPVLDRDETYNLLSNIDDSPENYSLIAALCAVIVLQPEILDPSYTNSGVQLPSADLLIKDANRARTFCDHMDNPSLTHVQTSFFFFAALFCLGKDNSAWFYIRESMTMLQLQRLHEESTYAGMTNPLCRIYCRRTFWLLFITERAYALQRHRPLTLQRTIDLPTVDPGPEATILSGFLDLVSLFQNFDDTFLSLWNVSGAETPASAQSLVQLQDILKFAIPNVSERTEIQQADLLVSRQWLKTMVWQLCVTKGLLSSASTNESMSFHYPVNIARDVVLVSRLLSPKAFEANGVGILEKIFDIGCSLSDVLQLHPNYINVSGPQIGPRDYLMELVRILGSAPAGNKYLRLLTEKADECLQVRIRGSLSDSEASDRVEEVLDDDEDEDEVIDFEDGNEQAHDDLVLPDLDMVNDIGQDYDILNSDIRDFGYAELAMDNPSAQRVSENHFSFSIPTPDCFRFLS